MAAGGRGVRNDRVVLKATTLLCAAAGTDKARASNDELQSVSLDFAACDHLISYLLSRFSVCPPLKRNHTKYLNACTVVVC